MENVASYLHAWDSHTIPPSFKPYMLVRRLGKIGSSLDRSVQKAASPMGAGDHWWTSSCDITEATAEPSMPDVDHARRGTCRTILGANHGATPITGTSAPCVHEPATEAAGSTDNPWRRQPRCASAAACKTCRASMLCRSWTTTARWQRSASDAYVHASWPSQLPLPVPPTSLTTPTTSYHFNAPRS